MFGSISMDAVTQIRVPIVYLETSNFQDLNERTSIFRRTTGQTVPKMSANLVFNLDLRSRVKFFRYLTTSVKRLFPRERTQFSVRFPRTAVTRCTLAFNTYANMFPTRLFFVNTFPWLASTASTLRYSRAY